MDEKLRQMKVDFRRMDLMLNSFQRIGVIERAWFIARLKSDHEKLWEAERAREKAARKRKKAKT